jgi:hypothetical protein
VSPREALKWGLETGHALGRPNGEVQDTVRVLIDWAIEHHRDWFYKFER